MLPYCLGFVVTLFGTHSMVPLESHPYKFYGHDHEHIS